MANTIKLGNGNWATKEGSLLAYNDERNNFKPLPFTTTRDTSATVVNKQGLIETVGSGIPRIDFSDDTNGALLLEPIATNLVVQSQVFSGYLGNNQIVTDNSIVSPDGTVTGAILADSGLGGNSGVQVYEDVTVDVSSTYTYSVFAKKKDLNFIALRTAAFTTPGAGQSYFDLNLGTTLGVATGHTSKIENYGNGWYRCSITFTTDAVVTTGNIFTRLSQNGTSSAVDLDNTSNVYIWGFQFEKNSYATSYIKNAGTALGVTRVADTATDSGNSTVINSTEGVLYAEISALSDDLTQKSIEISDSSTNNFVRIDYKNATSNTIRGQVRSGGLITASGSTVFSDIKDFHKIAISYKLNDVKLYIDGVLIFTDTSAIMPVGLDTLAFNEDFYGKTKSLQVYTTALSDAELTTLTTI